MSTNTICPSCQRPLRVPENLLGQQVKCPVCETTFVAADPTEEVPARAPQREPDRSPRREDREPERYRDRDRERERDRDRDRDREWDQDRGRRDRDRRRYDDEDEDYRRARPRDGSKPGKVQALALMLLIGGIYLCAVYGIGFLVAIPFSCGLVLLWPGVYLAVIGGILGIIRGAALMGDQAHREKPPTVVAILQICCILNLDLISTTLGIIELVFLNDPEVKGYLRG